MLSLMSPPTTEAYPTEPPTGNAIITMAAIARPTRTHSDSLAPET